MDISKHYDPALTEDRWYAHWMQHNYFHSEPDEREPFTIVIPPPNVTGVLHMGHMLNNTIQDILIRHARLTGKNACWVPGTDHASIATEAKVVKMLREKGIKKSDLTREEFLEHAWQWKEEYGGKILTQLRKLGASCDWERTAFTMDEVRSAHVYKAFIDLYERGKLYRDYRMVNWDPEAKTVLSNEEVLYSEEQSKLYHLRYQVEGSDEYLTIATTRPETLLGDTAVAVHPQDERYAHLQGKRVIVPLVNRAVPVIFDEYVDREFGTGALKVTPAHDTNDYDIGKRHDLEVIDIFNDDATMSAAAQLYLGQDRFDVRKQIVRDLEVADLLAQVEDYTNSVGRSERTGAVIEPKLSLQWYVDMPSLAEPALKSVLDDTIRFFPKHMQNTYRHWLENIRDWCISRQLWWGHRIPAWYYQGDVYVAYTAEEALAKARDKHPDLAMDDLRQDEDVLDTWFSSWLWPISVFDGWRDPKELDYYYPTNVLVTGWDIIFLWVARMIMAGYEWQQERPFEHVYFTGMVRDKQRRKMSKSLGNSPDALKLIAQYSADGVRFGLLSASPAGGDLLFDESLCEQGSKFCNKMWNALRLVKGWQVDTDAQPADSEALAMRWLEQAFSGVIAQVDRDFKSYRLSEAATSLYSFIWSDFCSWYLEMIKPDRDTALSGKTYEFTITMFERMMTALHPFMPFITEDIWHHLREREQGDDCIVSSWPRSADVDHDFTQQVTVAKDIVSNVRDIRNKNGLKQAEPLVFFAESSDATRRLFDIPGMETMLIKMAKLESVQLTEQEPPNSVTFGSGTDRFYVVLNKEIDVVAERERLQRELAQAQGFLKGVEKKLSNERFVNNAPEAVVAKERQKQADGQMRVQSLQAALAKLPE